MSSSRQALSAMLPSLTDKFKSADPDLRVMALSDFNKELERIIAANDAAAKQNVARGSDPYASESTEKVLTSQVLDLLYDSNSEVKNAAVRSLASMATRARSTYLRQMVATLTQGVGSPDQKDTNEESRDISCMALKSIVAGMSPEGDAIVQCLTSMIETIRANVTPPNANSQLASELLQILTDIYHRFPLAISQSLELQQASLVTFQEVFSTPRLSIRKRAVPALAAFISVCPTEFKAIKSDMAEGFKKGGDSSKAWIAAVAGLAKTSAASDIGALVANEGLVKILMDQTSNLDDSDAVEGALTALEVLVVNCPSETSAAVPMITERALELVKYDPNYVDFDDSDDVDMDDDDFDGDDEFDEGEYTDDEDDSWKIRRAAAKVLEALINARPDLLSDFYKTAAPVLIARFGEREESVRLEVLEAFEALLHQTVHLRNGDLTAGSRNKRKRSEAMDQDDERQAFSFSSTPVAALHDISPQLVKAILKQASAKTVTTRQQSFILLRQVVEALDGGLDNEADAICNSAVSALRSSDSTTSSFTIAVLLFLAAFFKHHVGRSYASHLDELTKLIVRCMRDKQQRVNFEAFATASSLAESIRPIHQGSASPLRPGFDHPVEEIFNATTGVLGDSSVDGDVREKALITLGDVLLHEGDALSGRFNESLPLITARLDSENTAATAIEVIGRVAESPLCSGPGFDLWLLEIISKVLIYIRRNKASLSKANEFATLQNVLGRIGASLPANVASDVIVELKPFLESNPLTLQIIAQVLASQPEARQTVDKYILPEVLKAIKSTNNATFIDEFVEFFGIYVDGDIDCSIRLVPSLVLNVTKDASIREAALSGTLAFSTTAKCIGTVVEHSERNLAGILATFQNTLKVQLNVALTDLQSKTASNSDLYLALLCIGEIGRFADLSVNRGLLEHVIGFFSNENEEIRSAAAFAAGNMAVGGPDRYLPELVHQLEATTDEPTRLLFLYALKEVIMHSSTGELEKLLDVFWKPLFGNANALDNDGVRNIKAACIGKLTIADPPRLIPQLQMLTSDTQQRALLAASIRYTFIDASPTYTELIAPIVGDFLTLMNDSEPIVRRLAVAALNAAGQNKPSLIADKLSTLQPYLYKETEVKKELQREVQMGPWKVIEDDGLENRKTAYETMYTLLATCSSKLDLAAFTKRVLAALADVNEIKVLGLMLLLRLAQLDPSTVRPHLDSVVDSLKAIMKDLEVKEDTIKQDLERKEEMQRSTMRTVIPLYRMTIPAQAPAFHSFVGGLLKMDQWKEFREYQA